jgi:Ca-activated chloride channel family protein
VLLAAIALTSATVSGQRTAEPDRPEPAAESFRFRSGVELINVTATVTDGRGRFVPGLGIDDFELYEDGARQPITHFSAERVPVSLGLVVDTSGSMEGDKWRSAIDALDRFLFDLLDPADEVFLYRFDASPDLVADWTTDREAVSRALGRIRPAGGTALLDAVADAVPFAQTGRHRKKAVLVISDGNDTSSHISAAELDRLIRETEVLVYAIGIDGRDATRATPGLGRPVPRLPIPFPIPLPGGGRRRSPLPPQAPPVARSSGGGLDAATLREITDSTGGRTELVRSARDLEPATAGIADELSRQYYLGYTAAAPRDGRWHAIRLDTRDSRLRVRARRGYMATP